MLEGFYLIKTIVSIALIVVGAVLAWEPVSYLLKSKLNLTNYDMLFKIVTTSVKWAEQWLKGNTGNEKKEQVLNWVEIQCDLNGIEFIYDEVDKLVEQAVFDMNKEKIQNEQ